MDLDQIDRAIVRELQINGRISNQDLSSRVGLSPSPCHRRVRHLEDAGVIKGYTAVIDAEKFGYPITISVFVRLERSTRDSITRFEDYVKTLDNVTECHLITGAYDYILRLHMRDLKEYETFLKDKLAVMPGITEIQSSIFISEIKSAGTFPDT